MTKNKAKPLKCWAVIKLNGRSKSEPMSVYKTKKKSIQNFCASYDYEFTWKEFFDLGYRVIQITVIEGWK